MINLVRGVTKKPATSEILSNFFSARHDLNGLLYIGYPILYADAENIAVDALWLSPEHGVIIFDLIENPNDFSDTENRQNLLFSLIDSQLRAYPDLKSSRRDLAVPMEIISFGANMNPPQRPPTYVDNGEELSELIANLPEWNSSELFEKTASIIQSVVNLKTRNKRSSLTNPDSRGSKIKKLEDTVATLDRNQEAAVIEYFAGVQRIRGLAGSGKTIVLALKAAYLHTLFPDWDIAVTFNTRSLKSQFKTLIERFCIEKKREAPDWNKLRVVNAWGSPKEPINEQGIYLDFCTTHGVEYLDFKRASTLIAKEFPFDADEKSAIDFVSSKAMSETKSHVEKYDAILVDEAQDLSESFLKICYAFLKPPKRLVFAYDELQKLNEGTSLRNPREFLIGQSDPFDDKILKVCYRNSRPLLVTAHALGFGIYRTNEKKETELVQFFDQPQLWSDLGYQVTEGELAPESQVTLARTPESSPPYLEAHSDIEDLIVFKTFRNKDDQAEWVASEIQDNIQGDELLENDIVVINPIALVTKKEVAQIRSLLIQKGINNHIAGEFNADIFHKHASVTFSGINRAKGNEVPMVYIINAQDCYSGILNMNLQLIRRRNILFTAITRSKAWVRVVGVGANMDKLREEYEQLKSRNFTLQFEYPTAEKIAQLNVIHRDISDSQKAQLRTDADSLNQVLGIIGRIKKGETSIEDYPENIRHVIDRLLNE